jgi:hypothetical protein
MLDTQQVSYLMATGSDWLDGPPCISSVTAQELLLMQTDDPARNAYYIPVPGRGFGYSVNPVGLSRAGRAAGRFKWQTDRLILDFDNAYPTVVEYSHQAVAGAINGGRWSLLDEQARLLGVDRHRVVRRRLRFLAEHGVQCVGLTRESAELGVDLLGDFADRYTLKRRFRNSLNDLLGLAVAVTNGTDLQTGDRLLARFARERLAAVVDDGGVPRISFETAPAHRVNRDAKGYVNGRWRVRAGGVHAVRSVVG